MYLKHIPRALRSGLSQALWEIPSKDSIYITFDDGPSENTPAILDMLSAFDAKATFFLLGENLEKYTASEKRIREEGHGVGNHGYSHLDGWRSSQTEYLENMRKGKDLVNSSDFRPPYGRMMPQQWRAISATERIVMWSLMPGDFDSAMNVDSCFEIIRTKSEAGSIIVLHDNEKSYPIVLALLPRVLRLFQKKGLRMEPLPS